MATTKLTKLEQRYMDLMDEQQRYEEEFENFCEGCQWKYNGQEDEYGQPVDTVWYEGEDREAECPADLEPDRYECKRYKEHRDLEDQLEDIRQQLTIIEDILYDKG